MFTTLGVVQACHDSPLLRGKAARKLGGKSLLEWVVRRATDCQRLSGVVVLLGNAPEHESLAELVPPDVPVYRAGQCDVLGRLVEALDAHPADGVVRVPADNLLVDPVLIDRLVTTAEEHPACDYIGYCNRDRLPAIHSRVGFFGEWCRSDALRRADDSATLAADRDEFTRYLLAHPERFHVRLIPVPRELQRDDLRLALNSEDDWDHMQTLVDALGHESLDWRRNSCASTVSGNR